MSDDYHRPTLTFPNDAYNATQVRLYGIQATGGFSFARHPTTLGDTGISVYAQPHGEFDEKEHRNALGILKDNEYDVAKIYKLILSGIIIWPPNIPTQIAYQLEIDMKSFGTIVISTSLSLQDAFAEKKPLSAGIIVGYAYEGHCYDLPKPKIMLIRAIPDEIPADDCGYDAKAPENYRVWIVDKLDQCVEFETNQGFVEQLVLEANLPGKRSPTMYAGKMMLGHRSGRLND